MWPSISYGVCPGSMRSRPQQSRLTPQILILLTLGVESRRTRFVPALRKSVKGAQALRGLSLVLMLTFKFQVGAVSTLMGAETVAGMVTISVTAPGQEGVLTMPTEVVITKASPEVALGATTKARATPTPTAVLQAPIKMAITRAVECIPSPEEDVPLEETEEAVVAFKVAVAVEGRLLTTLPCCQQTRQATTFVALRSQR